MPVVLISHINYVTHKKLNVSFFMKMSTEFKKGFWNVVRHEVLYSSNECINVSMYVHNSRLLSAFFG